MKISNTTTNLVNQAYSNNAAQQNQAAANTKPEKGKDINPSSNVDFSSKTLDLQKIAQTIENQPVAMSDKVAALKKEVDENRYNVDVEKVAGKIVGSLLDEII